MSPWGLAAFLLVGLAVFLAFLVDVRWPWPTFSLSALGFAVVLVGSWASRSHLPARSGVSLVLAGIVCAAVALVSVFAPGFLNSDLRMKAPVPESDPNLQLVVSLEATLEKDKGRPLAEDEWVDASKAGIRQDDLFIRIESVKIGRLPERGAKSYLLINYRVNQFRPGRKMAYQRYLPGESEPVLTDDSGRSYAFVFDRIRKTATKFHVLLRVDQILVFELPPSGIESLKLELPASAWGRQGVCRFRIADVVQEPIPVAARADEEHVQVLPARVLSSLAEPAFAAEVTQLLLLQHFLYASGPLAREIAEKKALLLRKPEMEPDPVLGRMLFIKTCQECHTLYGIGAKVGPDLTKSKRDDLDFLLTSIIDPSAVIEKEFRPTLVTTTKGLVLNGIVKKEDENAVTILIPNRFVVIPRTEIESMLESRVSLMPTELLKPFNEHEVRSLIAYLSGRVQMPILATPELARILFFSGRDLINWHSTGADWKVVEGEIVAPSPEAGRPALLISELVLAGDFQLIVRFHPGKDGQGAILVRDASQPERPSGPRVVFAAGQPLALAGVQLIPGEEKAVAASGVKADSWNKLEIIVEDNRVRVRLNDKDAVEATDARPPARRVIAFEGSSASGREIRFRNLDIRLPNDKK